MVIHDENLEGQFIDRGRGEFVGSHLETTVPDNSNDLLVEHSKLCPDCARKTKSHCSCAARTYPLVGVLYFVKLRCPHLMLTHVGRDDCLAISMSHNAVDDLLL